MGQAVSQESRVGDSSGRSKDEVVGDDRQEDFQEGIAAFLSGFLTVRRFVSVCKERQRCTANGGT